MWFPRQSGLKPRASWAPSLPRRGTPGRSTEAVYYYSDRGIEDRNRRAPRVKLRGGSAGRFPQRPLTERATKQMHPSPQPRPVSNPTVRV